VLHVMVVGFHHKRGCQVDYCYPPLRWNSASNSTPAATSGDSDQSCSSHQSSSNSSDTDSAKHSDDAISNDNLAHQLPPVWKTLPSVALPDGAHNYDRDT